MKKLFLLTIAAIALIACKPNGQDPSLAPTSAKIIAFKVVDIPSEGYRYDVSVQNELLETIASTQTVTLTTADLPKTLPLNKSVDVTKKLYKAAMWKQQTAGDMPMPIMENGELYVLAALKAIGYPREMEVYYTPDQGVTIKAIYAYE